MALSLNIHVRHALLAGLLALALTATLSACAPAPQAGLGSVTLTFALTRCDGHSAPAAPSARAPAQPTIYLSASRREAPGASLYALAPTSGATRWCDQFSITTPAPEGVCADGPCAWPPPLHVSAPLVVGGTLYLCVAPIGNFTYALDAATSAPRRSRMTGCAGTPAMMDGTLFSGSYALDPRDGSTRWRLPGDVELNLAANGMIYGFDQDEEAHTLTAWDAKTSKARWRSLLPDPPAGNPVLAGDMICACVLRGDEAPTTSPPQVGMVAIDAATGKLRWQARTGACYDSPLVADGVVYVGGLEEGVFALDATTGRVRWRYSIPNGDPSTPILSGGALYVAADGAGVFALDSATGAPRWSQPLDASDVTLYSAPTLANSTLYLVRTNASGFSALFALNMVSGRQLWSLDGFINLDAPPVAVS